MGEKAGPGEAKISFPMKCDYKGGIVALGAHGKHLWIKDGQLGVGEFRITRSIPLAVVANVELTERQVGGSAEQMLVASGTSPGFAHGSGGRPASRPKQVTDITVRTKDGQEGLWEVEHRGGEWVRKRLGPALREADISL
jgi:hypothetical protein